MTFTHQLGLVVLALGVVCSCGGDDRPTSDGGGRTDSTAWDEGGRLDARSSDDAGSPVDAGPADDSGGGDDGGGSADGGGPSDAGPRPDARPADGGSTERTVYTGACARTSGTCSNDTECTAGGCGGEMCASEELFTTCDCTAPPASCGCVDGMCRWYN